MSVCGLDGKDLREPVTLVERLTYALCAHDHMGSEGHLTDPELQALEHMIANYPGGLRTNCKWAYPILNLASMERERRCSEGKEVMLMHIIVRDWPNYIESANAALMVVSEIPEAGRQISEEAISTEAGDA